MSSNAGPGEGSNIFQTTDPFGQEQAEGIADHDDEDLRLAGVRSANPFASTDSRANDEQIESAPESALSPGAGRQQYFNQESTNLSATDSNDQNESVPTSAISPGGGALAKTDPFDFAASGSHEEGEPSTAPTNDLETVNSHVNEDRAERGTDVFANADPFFPNESSGKSNSESDSDSAQKDEKPRVAFAAGGDAIDEAPTHDDDDGDDSPNMMEKIKTKAKDKLHLHDIKATGPLKKFNPTTVHMRLRYGDDALNDVGIIWRSRDNRKGRNSVVIPRTSMAYPNLPQKNRPVYSSSFKGVGRNIYRMIFTFPYWDMAFWSGWAYTWGSVLFVIDGCWAWIPVGWGLDLGGIETYAIGVLFFVGALLYQLGAVMAYLEAVNDGSFHGSAMTRFLEGHEEDKKALLDEKIGIFFKHLNPLHAKKTEAEEQVDLEKQKTVDPEAGWRSVHRRERPGSIYPSGKDPGPRRGGVDLGETEEGETHEYLTWRWYPTWHALKTHHVYEIGYIACSIQLFGATLYSWCGLDSLYGIDTNWNDTELYGAYWMPEILGSCCFLTASIMFLVETQEKWWKPQPNVMGWWIGLWAFIGSMGFL